MSSNRKNHPIRNDAVNIFEAEFANMRKHFDDSMRQMDEDLSRFFSTPVPMIGHQDASQGAMLPKTSIADGNPSDWLSSSMIVKDSNNNQSLRMRFDLREFKPEEVEVTTSDGKVVVHAKHEEKSGKQLVFKEYRRELMLPKGVDANNLKTTLSSDGVLTIGGPLQIEAHCGSRAVDL